MRRELAAQLYRCSRPSREFALWRWDLAPLFAQVNLVLGGHNLLPFIPRNDGRRAWDALRHIPKRPSAIDLRRVNDYRQ